MGPGWAPHGPPTAPPPKTLHFLVFLQPPPPDLPQGAALPSCFDTRVRQAPEFYLSVVIYTRSPWILMPGASESVDLGGWSVKIDGFSCPEHEHQGIFMPGASKSMDFDAWSMPGAPQRGLERLREAPKRKVLFSRRF